MIETKHLNIYTASQKQMEVIIESQMEGALKTAYTEMLDGCLSHPDKWDWYAMWMIELKDGTHIGDLCFKGLNADGSSEIGYGIEDEYQGEGYATEAVAALVNWALCQRGVNCVTAEAEESNHASIRVLEKTGFIPTGKRGEEGPEFVRKK